MSDPAAISNLIAMLQQQQSSPLMAGSSYLTLPKPTASGTLYLRGHDQSPSEKETRTITILNTNAGQIIGRGGENLRKIEKQTGATVQFHPSTGAKDERKVDISGTGSQIRACIDAMYDAIDNSDRRDRGRQGVGGAQENTVHIKIPDAAVGLIIGRGGQKILELQNRSGSRINIKPETENVNGLRPATISGNAENNRLAIDFISDIVERDGSGSIIIGSQPTGPLPEVVAKSIQIAIEASGMVIGKGGESIRNLQALSHCQIKMHPEEDSINGLRTVTITGTNENIENAEQLINEKVAQYFERERDRNDRMYSSKNYYYDSSAANMQQNYNQGEPAQPRGGDDIVTGENANSKDFFEKFGGYQNYVNFWQQMLQQQQQQQYSTDSQQ